MTAKEKLRQAVEGLSELEEEGRAFRLARTCFGVHALLRRAALADCSGNDEDAARLRMGLDT